MTKPNPLSRAAATAAAAAGACLLWALAPGCSDALAAAKAKAADPAKSAFEEQPIGGTGSSTTTAHVGGSGGSIVRTIVGLAIVIAVIWGLSWILRQVKANKDPGGPSTGLTSLAALTLSAGRSVHLVRAGSDFLLLGSAEQGVVPIHRYTEEEAREAGLMDVVDAPGPSRRRALLRPPQDDASLRPAAQRSTTVRHGGHDPMRMPSPGPGTTVIDRLRELTVRR